MNQNSANQELKYLRLLGEQYPTIEALCTEITRISAQLSLPKGTEHFMSDLHGEYEAFCHIMNNCSGVIREKVNLWLGDQLTSAEADAFCTLIYYPEAILRQRRQKGEATPEWYRAQVERMVRPSLIANSHGMRLMSRQPFTNLRDAQETGRDIHSQSFEFTSYPQRKYLRNTDYGRRLERSFLLW